MLEDSAFTIIEKKKIKKWIISMVTMDFETPTQLIQLISNTENTYSILEGTVLHQTYSLILVRAIFLPCP